jgi:hypothetical protein
MVYYYKYIIVPRFISWKTIVVYYNILLGMVRDRQKLK